MNIPKTFEELWEYFQTLGEHLSDEPSFLSLHTPVSKDQGWVIQKTWMHHDGDIGEGLWHGLTIADACAAAHKALEEERGAMTQPIDLDSLT